MSSKVVFTSNEGVQIVNSIVKKLILKWNNGLREFQLLCIPKILNLEDVFAIEATGGGKSALFGVPILVHLEISRNPASYPAFNVPIRSNPVGVVVTPTKGLASDIVRILKIDLYLQANSFDFRSSDCKRTSTSLDLPTLQIISPQNVELVSMLSRRSLHASTTSFVWTQNTCANANGFLSPTQLSFVKISSLRVQTSVM